MIKKNPVLTVFTIFTLILLISPVCAKYDITSAVYGTTETQRFDGVSILDFNTTPGKSISQIGFFLPIGTTLNFTLNYGTSGSVTGWMIYRANTIIGSSYSEVSIGGVTYGENFIDAQAAGYSLTKHLELSGYAKNETSSGTWQTGIAVFDPWYGWTSSEIVFYPVNNIGNNLINSVFITADQNVDISINIARNEDIASAASQTVLEIATKIGSDYLQYATVIKDVFFSAIYWLKLIFVDNIVGVAALYFIGTAFYAANTSKNIFQFFTRWFKMQRSFIDFMIDGFYRLVGMVQSFIHIFF